MRIYSYGLNEELRFEVKRRLIMTSIIKAFEESKYGIEAPGTLHTFDLAISKIDKRESVVLDMAKLSSHLNERSFIMLFTKVFGAYPKKVCFGLDSRA
ncbi:MAG: hypothetical protein QW265_04115 [Candidatus Bathyarchaeia archaeon]